MCVCVCVRHKFRDTNSYAVVMGLVEDHDVARCVFGSQAKIRIYTRTLLETLQFLHSKNILYRDAKPSNLLWDDRRLKATIIDFDVATFFDRENLHRRHVGTEGYMAYEQDVIHDAEKQGLASPIKGYVCYVLIVFLHPSFTLSLPCYLHI